ncbi:hypothetical protein MUP77_01320 [Candidatus Bathyarchaeota archaeon]|nr:hypothetical protein [Candidatus Bathyarchaeota archaeon]
MEFQPQKWKPRAKSVDSIQNLPINRELICTVKFDGEFTAVAYNRGESIFSVSGETTLRDEAYPWLREVKERLDEIPAINSAVILGETYAKEGDRMLRLPDVVHLIKAEPEKIRLAVFDIVSVNGKTANNSYLWRLQELDDWFKGCSLIHIPPYILPKCYADIEDFWKTWVENLGYEGIFARDSHQDLWKLKPFIDLDAVIIGLNIRPRWEWGEVTSIKIALLDKDGTFIEVGDVASGIDVDLRKTLFTLMQFKQATIQVGQEEWVQITPDIVVQVQAMETFNAQKPRYRLNGGKLEQIGFADARSLRHPRLIRFRADKKAVYEDVGYQRQLLEEA